MQSLLSVLDILLHRGTQHRAAGIAALLEALRNRAACTALVGSPTPNQGKGCLHFLSCSGGLGHVEVPRTPDNSETGDVEVALVIQVMIFYMLQTITLPPAGTGSTCWYQFHLLVLQGDMNQF